MTEITKRNEESQSGAWVLYDADCSVCVALKNRFARVLSRHGFELAALQANWVSDRVGLGEGEAPKEMGVITNDDVYLGGPDALRHILGRIWWASPIAILTRLPLVSSGFDVAYRGFARRRHCLEGQCSIDSGLQASQPVLPLRWMPVVMLAIVGMSCWGVLEPWARMWLLAFFVYAFSKTLVLHSLASRGRCWLHGRKVGFALAWPGMDPRPFLQPMGSPEPARHLEWLAALGKTALGALLLWCVARSAWPEYPLLAGWLGMIGAIFMLHFGGFHLLALYWKGRGVDVSPIMRVPILATSVAEFWGTRWNRAFRYLAHTFVFVPGYRRLGRIGVALLVFAASGLIHELVISLPAGGGYGGPTLFFLIQFAGLHLQRSAFSRGYGLDRGGPGWLLTMLVVVGPVPLLFHPPFVEQVFLPFMQVCHAIQGGA
jgi:alginate O-acetyltransferase complex protein AlgI